MGAVDIIVLPKLVVVLTDIKTTTAESLQYNCMTIATLPYARLAIAVRGHIGALRVFERVLAMNAPAYDQALTFLAENFQELLAAEYIDATEAFAMKQARRSRRPDNGYRDKTGWHSQLPGRPAMRARRDNLPRPA